MSEKPVLYRKRLIPSECIRLDNDEILLRSDSLLVTRWKTIRPKKELSRGASCYLLDKGWKVSRMGKAELNILRLALYEMQYDDSVPVKVAINEAVELAKEYGSGDAHAFVNGILAKLIDRDLPEAEGEKAAAPEAAAPRQEEAPKDDEAGSL